MMYKISSYLKTSVFVRPKENDKPAFSKLSWRGQFLKTYVWFPKRPFACGWRPKKEKIFTCALDKLTR